MIVDKPISDAATADVVDTFSAPADKFTLEELTLPRLPSSIQRSSMRRQSSAFEIPSNGLGSSHVRRQSSAFELAALIKLRYVFFRQIAMFNSKFNHLTIFLSYQIKGRTISIVGSQLVPASSKEILLSKIWLVNSKSLNRPQPLKKNSNRKYQEINECRYRLPFCPRHLCRNKISKISSKCLLHLKRHQFEHQQFKR